MNVPATIPNLPAHLAKLASNPALLAANASAALGISSGGWPVVSIKGGKFRLVQADGQELLVPTHHLDVIIIDSNPHGVSKRYYDTKWDPNGQGEAPACYSDNGVGPSHRATKPQCSTCAMCPMNAWGSKMSEASGKAIKACSDLKKLAVFVADNTDGPVFELDVPADSLKNFVTYITALDKHGIPVSIITTRLSFDTNVSHPKLVFTPVVDPQSGQLPYITAEQAENIEAVLGTDEVDNCTGKNDKPIDATRAIAAPVATVATPMAVASPPMPPLPPVGAPPAPPTAAPVAVTPPAPPVAPVAPAAPVPPATTTPAPAKRTRTKKETAPAAPAAEAPVATPPFVASMLPAATVAPVATQNAAAAITPLNPPVADDALNALLARAMGT